MNSNYKRLKQSTLISLIGDELTNMAVLTLIYNITRSASLVAGVFVFRTMAIFVSGFIVPSTIRFIKDRKTLLISIDILRACIIALLVFFPRTEGIYAVIFVSYLLNGFYYPVKQSAVQSLIPSSERMQFISITQTYSYIVHFAAPLLSGVMLLYITPKSLIVIDAITFMISAIVLSDISIFNVDSKSQDAVGNSFYESLLSGYKKIFLTRPQLDLLSFRLLLLFALSIYDVLVMVVLTKFATNISYYELPGTFTFSLLLGIFTSLTAAATFCASLFTQYIKKTRNIDSLAKLGILFIIAGMAFWATPISFRLCWVLFIAGTFLIGFGLSFSRFFLYTAGYELTSQDLFVQIVSSSDAVARLWQSCISTSAIAMSAIFPITGIIFSSCFVMSFAIIPANRISLFLNKKLTNRIDALQDI